MTRHKETVPKKSSLLSQARKPVAAGLAALAGGALVPQHSSAAIVTVGGDGGVGSVTLANKGNGTDIGGLLVSYVAYGGSPGSSYDLRLANTAGSTTSFGGPSQATGGLLGNPVRSVSSNLGSATGSFLTFAFTGTSYQNNAQLGSADNWIPGHFVVPSVSANRIYGWLQVEFGSSDGDYDPSIISFTYDDAATDTTAFAKPIGGFTVIPEPSSAAFLGVAGLLALGAAGVREYRRRKQSEASA